MSTMKGPAIFLAQFVSGEPPFNSLPAIARWAGELGYTGIQIPSWEGALIDLEKAAQSQDYCDELKGICAESGVEISELSTHIQGQLVAVHPAYDEGLNAHATFSGALLWHTMYPWPQRPQGLVETGFRELADRWLPILDAFDEAGVDLCYEIHPGEDLHDGVTFERFFEATGNHRRCHILYDPSHFMLQQLDYIQFIDFYHERIKMFHVKDAEFNPNGKSGVYGGYQGWVDRPGRFRSLGDGQVDFSAIFAQFARYGYAGWAVLEWECCL